MIVLVALVDILLGAGSTLVLQLADLHGGRSYNCHDCQVRSKPALNDRCLGVVAPFHQCCGPATIWSVVPSVIPPAPQVRPLPV